MPLVRKIIHVGRTSRGITLPKSWLECIEERHGKVDAVSMEVNDAVTIRPFLKKEPEKVNENDTTTN